MGLISIFFPFSSHSSWLPLSQILPLGLDSPIFLIPVHTDLSLFLPLFFVRSFLCHFSVFYIHFFSLFLGSADSSVLGAGFSCPSHSNFQYSPPPTFFRLSRFFSHLFFFCFPYRSSSLFCTFRFRDHCYPFF